MPFNASTSHFPHLLWGDRPHFHILIALTPYLGSWALVAPIIAIKFLLNHHPFLLEAIDANDFSPFPYQNPFEVGTRVLPLGRSGMCYSFHAIC
jgi:hypothetical protein